MSLSLGLGDIADKEEPRPCRADPEPPEGRGTEGAGAAPGRPVRALPLGVSAKRARSMTRRASRAGV